MRFVHPGDISMLYLAFLHNQIHLPQKKPAAPRLFRVIFNRVLVRQAEAGDKIYFSQCRCDQLHLCYPGIDFANDYHTFIFQVCGVCFPYYFIVNGLSFDNILGTEYL